MNLRVLYLFSGPRRKIYNDFKDSKVPGIDLVGLNLMADYGIDATFLENRATEFLRKISFNLVQLPVFTRLHTCDVIFAGSGFLTLFILKYILHFQRPKWVVYNTYLSNLLKRNKTGLKGWIIRKAIFSADAIVSPSLSQRDFLKEVGLSSQKNYYAPYGINYNFFNKKGAEVEETRERYLFSSGRDVGRDYKTLIEAVKDLPVKLLIAALPRNLDGVTEWPTNVSVAQFDQAQMTTLMKKSEFIVIPTISESKLIGSDCSGQYALLRAMTCGKAVITSKRSTLAEYFTPGKHGFIVKPEDVNELKEAIKVLWNDPAKAKTMGEAGRNKIKKGFTMEIFSKRLASIFYEVVGK